MASIKGERLDVWGVPLGLNVARTVIPCVSPFGIFWYYFFLWKDVSSLGTRDFMLRTYFDNALHASIFSPKRPEMSA